MAYQVDKEANFTNESDLPQIQNGKSLPATDVKPDKKTKKTQEKVTEILLAFNRQPLISCEISLNLLKIQSKFVSSHPCLCTSRFRHTLHQLDEEHHQDLDRLCSQLSLMLKLEDEELDKNAIFQSIIPCVFGDVGNLQKKTQEWLKRSGQDQNSGQDLSSLDQKLNGILGRLVTDYRAIFAIEVEFSRSFEKSDDELGHATTEHRKRHEFQDSCPEEIKLMKVACEELTLECNAEPKSGQKEPKNGPKFCLKSLTSQEVPEKDNSIHRHPQQNNHNAALEDVRSRHHHRRSHHYEKGTSTTSTKVVLEVETDSTPVSSDVEQNPSPRRSCQRKRKERRDSIGEGQDKKFSKSSSDVFPASCVIESSTTDQSAQLSNGVRRVQSNRDFVSNNNQECTKCSEEPSKDKCTFYVSDDEIGNESKCLGRAIVRPRRSRKVRTDSLKENQEETKEPVLPWKKSANLSPPPLSTPPPTSTSSAVFDLVKSHLVQEGEDSKDSDSTSSSASDETLLEETFSVKTMNNSSPVQDSQNNMYQPVCWEPYGNIIEHQSTRHFGMLNSKQHLDKHHLSNHNDNSKTKMKQLSKQLSVTRKRIEEFEVKFEEAHGYRPSQAEKQSNKEVRKLILQQNRLKRQIRTFRESGDSGINLVEDYSPASMSPTRPWSPACSDFASILNVYSEESCSNSIDNIDKFKNVVKEIEEKLDAERLACGRPKALDDMSPDQVLQEKSSIQMALNQAQNVLNKAMTTDDEKVLLKDLLNRYRSVKRLVRRSSNILIKDPCELETIPEGSEIQLTLASPQHRINIEMNSKHSFDEVRPLEEKVEILRQPESGTSDPEEANLHAMSRMELLNVQKMAKEDKKQLRRWLKEREAKFLQANGRPMPKDELKDHDVYTKYKMTKAKLKLVDALLSKFVK